MEELARQRLCRLLTASVALAILLALGACRGNGVIKPDPPIKLRNVVLVMADDANDDWPVAVDMVRVNDGNLLTELLRIESAAWFGEAGEKFRRANPQALIDQWEIVPGTTVGPVNVRVRQRVTGVVFCDIAGTPPVRLGYNGDVTLRIEDDGCTMQGGRLAR